MSSAEFRVPIRIADVGVQVCIRLLGYGALLQEKTQGRI